MNKTAMRVISIILALTAILTAYGCKGSEEKAPAELNQPAVEGGTAVIEYPTVNADGDEVQTSKTVKVEDKFVNVVSTGSTLDKELDDEESKKDFVDNYQDNYELSDDKAEEIVNNAAKWTNFNYIIYVANSTAKPIAFRYLETEQTENIRVNAELDCQYGIPSGVGMSICLEGIYNAAEYEDAEVLKEALRGMNIQIKYASMESINDDIDDWSTVETKLMKLEIK